MVIKRVAFLFAVASSCVCFPATFADGHGLFNRRLGMFVHWGIYSVGEWHEQEEMRRGMGRADYEKFAGRFTAEKFDAEALVGVAESAGAEYIVFTSKHHDGFCMWDTKTTDFKVANTPANSVVFVGNFSGKQVTVDVESVAADKTRLLLSNGAEIVSTSIRLAPWGFAFLEDMKK